MARQSAAAGSGVARSSQSAPAALTPPPPPSPVDQFRSLLVMPPAEQREFLAKRSPEAQKLILAKIHEYQELTPEMRELRLRVTELRWYLLPLLNTPAAQRAPQLNLVPAKLRDLVEARLSQWDKLPADVQKEFLDNEATLRFYFELAARTPAQLGQKTAPPSPAAPEQMQQGIRRWQELTDEQRQEVVRHFRQFLELTSAEQDKTLSTISGPERVQIEKTLQTFSGLSPAQRMECVRSFKKFANFTPEERRQFLHNAERWEKMSPTDREAWRNLVSNLSHEPPLPPGADKPPLPGATRPPGNWATNGN